PLSAELRRALFPVAVDVPIAKAVIGAVDPIIARPEKAVRVVFGIGLIAVVVAHLLLLIGFAVTIGVFKKPEVRRFGDEQSAADHGNRARHEQAIDENGALIHASVAVGILKQTDAPVVRIAAFAIRAAHKIAHFQDVKTPIGIKLDLD